MVALLSPSSTKLRRSRKADAPARSLPATLVTDRISELHRRLIDPASDVETVKAAKHSLLRLLSDPITLPVITMPAMAMPLPPEARGERKSTEAKRVCEICERPLATISAPQHEGTGRPARSRSTRSVEGGSFRSNQQKPRHGRSLSKRTTPGMPLSRDYSLS